MNAYNNPQAAPNNPPFIILIIILPKLIIFNIQNLMKDFLNKYFLTYRTIFDRPLALFDYIDHPLFFLQTLMLLLPNQL